MAMLRLRDEGHMDAEPPRRPQLTFCGWEGAQTLGEIDELNIPGSMTIIVGIIGRTLQSVKETGRRKFCLRPQSMVV